MTGTSSRSALEELAMATSQAGVWLQDASNKTAANDLIMVFIRLQVNGDSRTEVYKFPVSGLIFRLNKFFMVTVSLY